VMGAPPEVTLNGQLARLSPGVRVRNQANMLEMTGGLTGQPPARQLHTRADQRPDQQRLDPSARRSGCAPRGRPSPKSCRRGASTRRRRFWTQAMSAQVKKVFIKTFGCQMNEYDSDKMVDVLHAADGYEKTSDVDEGRP